jgi:hypothetical protein
VWTQQSWFDNALHRRETNKKTIPMHSKSMLYPETALLLNRGDIYREKFDQALQIYEEGLVIERAVLSSKL